MAILSGNLEGLKTTHKKYLERLGRKVISIRAVIPPRLAVELVSISKELSRQVGIFIDRQGNVTEVTVGKRIDYQFDGGSFRSAFFDRLAGLKFIHVHPAGGLLDMEDIIILTRMRLDLIGVLLPDASGGNPLIQVAYPVYNPLSKQPYEKIGPSPISSFHLRYDELIKSIESEFRRNSDQTVSPSDSSASRAILIHLSLPGSKIDSATALAELEKLGESAGVRVVDRVVQRRGRIDPACFIGRGKLIEVMVRSMLKKAGLLIFDHDLSPRQCLNIETMTGLRVIDRTQLILDIFAQRAQTRDGKIQVELAQLKYLMPRLVEKDDSLSRLTGGIGARGPGETKLEIGRRRVREKIARLTREIQQIARRRRMNRARREKAGMHLIALVGYTNAGKSTILNKISGSSEIAEDKLFSTLDPRSRRIYLPSNRYAVLTDTVGLIRQLPSSLFTAFKPTFEQLEEASLILIVVDCADEEVYYHLELVDEILDRVGLSSIPRLFVLNKIDIAGSDIVDNLKNELGGVAISALTGKGIKELLTEIDRRLP